MCRARAIGLPIELRAMREPSLPAANDEPVAGQAVTVRTAGLWWAFLAIYGVIAMAAIGGSLNSSIGVGGRVACAALAIGLVAFLVRSRRAGISASDDGVTVRRYLGATRTVPWSRVNAFEPVASRRGGVHVGVGLVDGTTLITQGAVVFSGTKLAGFLSELECARPDD